MNHVEKPGSTTGTQCIYTPGGPFDQLQRTIYSILPEGSIFIADRIEFKCQTVDRILFSFIRIISAGLLLVSHQVIAAEWLVTPSLLLKETYTDNVSLAPTGDETRDWVTEVDPGIFLTGTSSRLKAKVNYVMQNLFYSHNSSDNSTNNQLNANANAKLLDEFLFLDANASVSQQNISLFGAQASDNTNITRNRANVANYSISPYLRHSFDATASYELRYTHSKFYSDTYWLNNSVEDSALLDVISGAAFSTLGWGLHLNKQTTYYDNGQRNGTQIYSGDLRFPITPSFGLTAAKGYENYEYLSITGLPPEGHFWSAGISWNPSARTSIKANTGQRFYGKSHFLAATHHSRNTVWSLNYNEDITTTQSQFIIPGSINTFNYLDQLWTPSIPDPLLRQQYIDNFIRNNNLPTSLASSNNYFTNSYFLQKQWQASVAINSAKSTLLLSGYDTLRIDQSAQTIDTIVGSNSFNIDQSTKQIGGIALWNWRYTPRTNFNVSTTYSNNLSIPTGITNITLTMILGMTRQFKPKLHGALNLRRTYQHPNQLGVGYLEHAVIASLLMQF